jgi:hypothetical protein
MVSMEQALRARGFSDVRCAKFGFLFPQYHLHILLTWLPATFAVGHWISQHVDATADSLIFTVRKPDAMGAVRRSLAAAPASS